MNEHEHAQRRAKYVQYLSRSTSTREALIGVLSRLPDDALAFAVEKCVFVSVGGGVHGQCLPSHFIASAECLITISDDAPDLETIIAHEVAHAFLGHPTDVLKPEEAKEKAARAQARAWGFTGKGADS